MTGGYVRITHLKTEETGKKQQTGRAENVCRETKWYKIIISAPLEIRWEGKERIDKKYSSILYGGEDKRDKMKLLLKWVETL